MSLAVHTLLIKTLTHCNLACDYCYVHRLDGGQSRQVISDELVSKVINDYTELAELGRGTGPQGNWMVFLWHGGEPTLAGINFFERVLER
jgi:uncharacterized protein